MEAFDAFMQFEEHNNIRLVFEVRWFGVFVNVRRCNMWIIWAKTPRMEFVQQKWHVYKPMLQLERKIIFENRKKVKPRGMEGSISVEDESQQSFNAFMDSLVTHLMVHCNYLKERSSEGDSEDEQNDRNDQMINGVDNELDSDINSIARELNNIDQTMNVNQVVSNQQQPMIEMDVDVKTDDDSNSNLNNDNQGKSKKRKKRGYDDTESDGGRFEYRKHRHKRRRRNHSKNRNKNKNDNYLDYHDYSCLSGKNNIHIPQLESQIAINAPSKSIAPNSLANGKKSITSIIRKSTYNPDPANSQPIIPTEEYDVCFCTII